MKTTAVWAPLLVLLLVVPVHAQRIVAHRGASRDAPENTLAAFRLAWERGADAIEGDFYLTRDQRIVCIHDDSTKRTAGRDLSVARSTLDELRELEYGSWKGSKWQGEPIPTLEQVLATVPDGKSIFIEIKCGPEIVAPLERILASSGLEAAQTTVIAFNEKVVAETKRRIPRIKAHWLVSYKENKDTGRWAPALEQVLETLKRCDADGLDTQANLQVLGAPFVAALRQRDLEFHAWTVNDPVTAAGLQALGVDSITTDRPAFLRRQLPTRGLGEHLQVHLRLDGDLQDSSTHGRHGVLVGQKDPGLRYARAVFGRGLNLAGNKAAVAVRYKLPETGSMCLWYRTRSWYDYQTLIDNVVDADCWEMWIYKTGQLKFRDSPRGASVVHSFHPTGDVDEWHHIAVTWDRRDLTEDAMRLFVNGYLVDSMGSGERPWVQPGPTLFLGGGSKGNTRGNGTWDDFAVFDTVLRPADVRVIMNGGVATVSTAISGR